MSTARPCAVCGARVTARRSKAGRAYTICNGADDAQACGSRVVYGARHTRQILEGPVPADKPSPAKDPARSPARAPRSAARPAATKPPAATSPTPAPPEADAGGTSWGGLDDW